MMTVKHHPDDDLLLSYAAGSLSESWSLAIAAHLAFCPACRSANAVAESIGGVLLEETPQEAMSAGALDQVLARLDEANQDPQPLAARPQRDSTSSSHPVFPTPLRDYVGHDANDVPWQRLGGGAYQYLIETSDPGAQARLLRITAGKPVPSHGHGGRELTLVLAGEFEDEVSVFGRGDLEDVGEETVHKPVAGPRADCICLAVTDAPLQFKEFLPRILQPLLRI